MDGPQIQVVSKETLRALHPEHPEAQPEPAARLGSIAIGDRAIAERLAQFNRRGRMAFWSVRRRGGTEAEALAAAERTVPR